MNEETTKKKPVAKLKVAGTGASASIWKNEAGNGGAFYSFSLQRTFDTGQGLKNSSSFPIDNTDVARLLLQKVDEWKRENVK